MRPLDGAVFLDLFLFQGGLVMARRLFSLAAVAFFGTTLVVFAQERQTPGQAPRTSDKQQSVAPDQGLKDKATPDKPGRRHKGQKRVYLGVYTVPVEDMSSRMRRRFQIKDNEGVVVVEVMPDSPAEDAGLRHGDVITHVNGKLIEDEEELSKDIHQIGAGKEVKLSVIRDGKKREMTAELEEGPAEAFSEHGFGHGEGREFNGPAAHESQQRIEHLERKIARLEKRLEELERNQSGKKP
jgi:membrane-associated protease RseP (regulator of RpoE activity)